MRSALPVLLAFVLLGAVSPAAEPTDEERQLATGHPRPSYAEITEDVVDRMEAALRKQLAQRGGHSYSRGWWVWDRLRARYVDGGRKGEKELKILRAVFRAWIIDQHKMLEAKGEGDLMFLFFTTTPGHKVERKLADGRTLKRDVHGGGYHGGWGGAARMRIYEELAGRGMLTNEEQARMKKLVHQSFEKRFLNFTKGAQSANNHSFGNGGGIALALKLFPDPPQAGEAKAWLDRIWNQLADFGDWKEWNYYPYGPIFLHGMLDIAEATGRMESDRELIESLGQRVLAFNHAGGVKGNPNCGSRVRGKLDTMYADPWNVGYYDVETSGRDGHFWYRLAQHFKSPEFLWAAEQVTLGGRPPEGEVPKKYKDAYARRFAWFEERGIKPKLPVSKSSIGFLSTGKRKIHERLYLNAGRQAGKPFAAFFLYPHKDEHLDNISGHLYEYSHNGVKYLHSSGKYSSLGRGGGAGEESLDLLLVMQKKHPFPVHPDGSEDPRDFKRRGAIQFLPELTGAENNDTGDSFGQFGFAGYYGTDSRWTRRAVLTAEGYLVVADEYRPGEQLGEDYHAGPVWHLARSDEPGVKVGPQERNWFSAPPMDQAWWQTGEHRVRLVIHHEPAMKLGSLHQAQSQDLNPNVTAFGYRPIKPGKPERFLSVFIPHRAALPEYETAITGDGSSIAMIGKVRISIHPASRWSVARGQ